MAACTTIGEVYLSSRISIHLAFGDDSLHYLSREALSAVSVFDNKKKTSTAWNADLMFGSCLKIPVSAYKMVCYSQSLVPSLSVVEACNCKFPLRLIRW